MSYHKRTEFYGSLPRWHQAFEFLEPVEDDVDSGPGGSVYPTLGNAVALNVTPGGG